MTPEQELVIRLILASHIVWDRESTIKIMHWLEASPLVKTELGFDEAMMFSSEKYPITCIGCCSVHKPYTSDYPLNLVHCPGCSPKPLKYNGQFLRAGEAKLHYISDAMSFANTWTRDLYINKIIARRH